MVNGESARQSASPLPPRLGDPLAIARVLAWIGLIVSLIRLAMTMTAIEAAGRLASEISNFASELVGLVFVIFVLRTLPTKYTNAIYLRSFRRDDDTARVRQAIQRGLGRSFRLSGIRDPRRRMSTFMKYALNFIFCLKYSTTRHMNLEAGDDWFARLWSSLLVARCAFLDLTDLTDYVAQEADLVYRTLGPSRVLFLGDQARTPEEWRTVVAERLGLPPAEAADLQIATWDRGRNWDTAEFTRAVRAFAEQLPPGEVGSQRVEMPAAVASAAQSRHSVGGYAVQAIAGFVAIPMLMLVIVLGVHTSGNPVGFLVVLVSLSALMGLYVLYSLCVYLIDCGSARERAVTAVFLAPVLLLVIAMVGGMLMSVQKVHTAAEKAITQNNLKQISMAIGNYEASYRQFPSASKAKRVGGPLHSWRVLLLPLLETPEDLYKQYNFEEPWDGPNNRKLADRMPKVYRHPADDPNANTTRYLLITGDGTAHPRPGSTRTFNSIEDGVSNTICLIESPGKAVNWMDPTDLDVEELVTQFDQLRERKIRWHQPGVHAAMFDGSVYFLPSKTSPSKLRALMTVAGGEVVSVFDVP